MIYVYVLIYIHIIYYMYDIILVINFFSRFFSFLEKEDFQLLALLKHNLTGLQSQIRYMVDSLHFFGIFSTIVNHQHDTIFWNSNSNQRFLSALGFLPLCYHPGPFEIQDVIKVAMLIRILLTE